MTNYMIKKILLLLGLASFTFSNAYGEAIEVEFVYVGEKNHSALLGIKQGLSEANLQGQFLNQKYELDELSTEQLSNTDFSNYIAILSTVDKDTYLTLSENNPETPIFNLSLNDDSLRTSCIENALHIIPSNKMMRDAENQMKQKDSESRAKAQAWHPDFKKFAARDLNKRFKKSFNVAMDDHSWSGWAAVKMTSDSVARGNITSPAKMLAYLKNDIGFDGQKGSNMNFRETGQLRQLILLIDNDKIVAEAPIRGVAKPAGLDSLGNLNCEK